MAGKSRFLECNFKIGEYLVDVNLKVRIVLEEALVLFTTEQFRQVEENWLVGGDIFHAWQVLFQTIRSDCPHRCVWSVTTPNFLFSSLH